MNKFLRAALMIGFVVAVFAVSANVAHAGCTPSPCQYVFANSDVLNANNSVNVYRSNGTGAGASITLYNSSLSPGGVIAPGFGWGNGGLDFSIPLVTIDKSTGCVVVADTYGPGGNGISDFWTIDTTLHTHGPFISSHKYSGTLYGLGLAAYGGYLVANYTGSGILETWKFGSNCTLAETGFMASAHGAQGGVVDGMTNYKNEFLAVAYNDGSVGTFLLPDLQPATLPVVTGGYKGYGGIPTQVDVWQNGTHLYLVVGNAYDDFFGTLWDLYEICTASCPSGVTLGQIYGDITTYNTSGSDAPIYTSVSFVLDQAHNTVHAIGGGDWEAGPCLSSCVDVATDTITTTGVVSDSGCTSAAVITGWTASPGWFLPGTGALSGDGTVIYVAMAGFGYNGSNGSIAIVPDTGGCASGTVNGATGGSSGSGLTSPNSYFGFSLQSYPGTPTQ
jgi:hypothetical protein